MNINTSDHWVKLHLRTLYSDLFSDVNAWRLFMVMLLSAHYEDDFASIRFEGKQKHLKAGQLAASRAELAELVNLPLSTTRNSLERLLEDKRVDKVTDKHITIWTICNWEKYQGERTTERTTKRTTTGQSRGQPLGNPEDNQTDTKRNKEIKNIRNKEKTVDYIEEFILHRKAIKSPLTELALSKTIAKLEQMYPGNEKAKKECIEQSIINGWKGIFALKENDTKPKTESLLQRTIREESMI